MKSTWQKSIDLPIYPPLSGDTQTEVLIIGAGITGIVTGYLLAKAGKKVIIIDKDTLVDSATAITTGFLTSAIDTRLSDLVTIFGETKAHDVWSSHDEAAKMIEDLVKSEEIDCEFTKIHEYFYSLSSEGKKSFDEERALADKFGFETEDLNIDNTTLKNFGGFTLLNQAKFNPLKYLLKLRRAVEFFGGNIYENTEALSIDAGPIVKVRTNHGTISAENCIVATHLSIKNPFSILARKGEYYSYVLELRIPAGYMPEGLYIDDMDPYHYIRIDAFDNHYRMIVGGEDHRKVLGLDPQKCYSALEEYVKKNLPHLKYEIVTKWFGPIIETLDGLAYIGNADHNKNMFYATGFSGNGMTYSHIAAKIISGRILGQPDKYEYLYTPKRKQFTLSGLLIKSRDYLRILFGGYLKNVWKKPKGEIVSPL